MEKMDIQAIDQEQTVKAEDTNQEVKTSESNEVKKETKQVTQEPTQDEKTRALIEETVRLMRAKEEEARIAEYRKTTAFTIEETVTNTKLPDDYKDTVRKELADYYKLNPDATQEEIAKYGKYVVARMDSHYADFLKAKDEHDIYRIGKMESLYGAKRHEILQCMIRSWSQLSGMSEDIARDYFDGMPNERFEKEVAHFYAKSYLPSGGKGSFVTKEPNEFELPEHIARDIEQNFGFKSFKNSKEIN